MKIIFATGTFFPEVSGQSNFIYNFIKNLGPDYEVAVVAYGDSAKSEVTEIDGKKISVEFVKRDKLRFWHYYAKVRTLSQAADLIYAQDLVSSGFPAALAKNKKVRLVIRIGGDFLWEKMANLSKTVLPLSQYYQQPKNLKEKLYLLIYRYVLSRSDNLIFNTEWQKKLYAKYFNLNNKKISVISNPFIEAPQESGRQTRNKEIIFAGRLIPLKNLERLIEAFRELRADKKLIIIGKGPLKNKLEALAEGDSRIEIITALPQNDLWQRIGQCHLFILPSFTELNPNAALEALSLKKPVILTQENGLPENLKSYFKLINPFSKESIRQALEYFEDDNNYNKQQEIINGMNFSYSWEDVIAEHRRAGII